MGKHSACVMLILAFLQTGRTNNRISIFQKREHNKLTVSCNLMGDDNVSQINWESKRGDNATTLGIFNPKHGTYISEELKGSTKIEGHSNSRTTSIILMEPDVSNGTWYCCTFIAFPSGTMQGCTEAGSTVAKEKYSSLQTAETLLLVVFIIPIITITVMLYFVWQHFLSRRRVFEVQRVSITDAQMDTEESTEGSPQPHSQTEQAPGIDLSKLYAHVKIDRYYERLWKACQATSHGWSPLVQAGTRRIYYLLGEHKAQQNDDEDLLQT
ncbi:transmembrane protein PVRIG-like [Arapaima gigas]